ncbi:MAG: penicillin-binding protein 2 [Patescibacteria group bacterium]|nr:penicillin-binding protein 2 [Patescibacteria group bacterium]
MFVKKTRQRSKTSFFRFYFLAIIFFIFGSLIILRLIQLQILDYRYYQNKALEIRTFEKEVQPKRGEIFIEEEGGKRPVAINIDSYNLYAVPKEIDEPIKTAEKIAPLIGISLSNKNDELTNLIKKLSKENDWYEILKKDISQEEVDAINKLSLKGIKIETVTKRFYPEKKYFAHLLGFVGFSGDQQVGRYGLENYYENILSGKEGLLKGEKTQGGVLIATAQTTTIKPKDGADLILTIDRNIQIKTCQILEEAIKKYQAEKGNIIVLEPKSGQILALCNWPSFDPNQYNEVKDSRLFLNEAVSSQYEPGSIFKTITFAAALEEGKITPETTYEDKGLVKIGGYTIKNAGKKVYGFRTMKEVLEKSINTGAIFAAQKLGLEKFRQYVEKFGFGSLTGVDLPTEAKGNIKNLSEKKEIYLATASFGQGLSVTPLQMVTAFAALANHGKLMKPYLVKKIISDGFVTEIKPEERAQVISPTSAEILKEMLISVVKNGWGKRAAVKGYLVAGKTGTAQVAYLKGYSEKTIHSFAGFAPANDPRFVALVKLDNPKLERFSDRTAAPVFGQLADFLLKYFAIPPTEIE